MAAVAEEIRRHLKPLVGLKLARSTRAGDMQCFQFGELREVGQGTVGQYALHVQCAWRIEWMEGIVTGHSDLWKPVDDSVGVDWATWDRDEDENLRDELVDMFMQGYDPHTGSFTDDVDMLIVEAVMGDSFGGAALTLSGGFRLAIFPAGTRGEDWRVFQPGTSESPFVISGGKIQAGE